MVYLVRHGQTDWNLERKIQGGTDIPLNENGRMQAKEVSEDIAKLNIDKIICSNMSRAKETAEIINQKVGKKITIDNRLRETDYGDMEGKPVTSLTEEDWQIFNSYPEKVNGESRANVYKRIKSFMDDIKEDKENILVVTHGGALRMIKYYKSNKDGFDDKKYIDCIKGTKIANTQLFEFK